MTVAEDVIRLTIIIAQYLTCSVFLLFLIHKLLMLTYYHFITRRDPVAGKLPDERPFVTVQLPCFNEAAVIRRVIDASCSMKWPRDRFEVHVLDDSNDVTVRMGRTVQVGDGACLGLPAPSMMGAGGATNQHGRMDRRAGQQGCVVSSCRSRGGMAMLLVLPTWSSGLDMLFCVSHLTLCTAFPF